MHIKKEELPKKIYFCFPYRGVGGVSFLFLRVAKQVNKILGIKPFLIDFHDGYMSKNVDNRFAEIEIYSEKDPLFIEENSVIVFQSMTPWTIFSNIKIPKNTKVLFWTCHPHNFIPNSPFSEKFSKLFLKNYYNKSKKFVQNLANSDGLFFMDEECLIRTQENLDLSINNPMFLPIPSAPSSKNFFNDRDKNEIIKVNLCWVGRLVDFKYYILKKLILDLEKVSSSLIYDFEITIIGDGPFKKTLKKVSSKSKNISFKYINNMEEQELHSYLKENVDILFAMGTSALEGARLGIPTVLLDYSYSEVDFQYKYKWLFERDGSTLGKKAVKSVKVDTEPNFLIRIVNAYVNNRKNISAETYKYFQKNHDIDMITAKLLNIMVNSESYWTNLQNESFLKKGIIYKIYLKLKIIREKFIR